MQNHLQQDTLQNLFEQWKSGDPDALNTIFTVYFKTHFLPIAKAALKNESQLRSTTEPEGLVSQTFEKMRKANLKTFDFRGERPFWAWVKRQMSQVKKDLSRRETAQSRQGGRDKTLISLTAANRILDGGHDRGTL